MKDNLELEPGDDWKGEAIIRNVPRAHLYGNVFNDVPKKIGRSSKPVDCLVPGCNRVLSRGNKTGYCFDHKAMGTNYERTK